ncbi:hypothetical protein NUW54_g13067 [Trametes sanguinea]|uniref:Uncharacterized protein n=1 Tax=Trametes sanguinea TaxID=158606 RepID=A0ACC1MQN3_9APHY|nr:hypothetical protein NUW54_g13067 [Trametes sanguinea]
MMVRAPPKRYVHLRSRLLRVLIMRPSPQSLDIQYTVGVATNVPVTFITVGPNTNDGALDGFLDIITTLTKQDNPPLVLTTSFGFDETPFAEQAPELAETLCNAYAQLGARGTSILFASGDGGVSGSQADDSCDGSAFIPTFPATCPYLTAVGSTQGINPETAADFSAGGFSNIFARPDYQSDAVDGYLKTLGNTNQGLFNTTGRGYPDVSTQGVQFVIEAAGQLQGVDGTSASSPTFASVVALLNDQLLNAGQSPLGFLNPLLYSKGVAALNDITSGSNPGCGTQGFPAAAGWDAVTGLGTPDFQKLLSVVSGGASASQNSTDNSGAAQAPAGQNSTATAGAGPCRADIDWTFCIEFAVLIVVNRSEVGLLVDGRLDLESFFQIPRDLSLTRRLFRSHTNNL